MKNRKFFFKWKSLYEKLITPLCPSKYFCFLTDVPDFPSLVLYKNLMISWFVYQKRTDRFSSYAGGLGLLDKFWFFFKVGLSDQCRPQLLLHEEKPWLIRDSISDLWVSSRECYQLMSHWGHLWIDADVIEISPKIRIFTQKMHIYSLLFAKSWKPKTPFQENFHSVVDLLFTLLLTEN
jgi:hypothetical protein